MGLPTTRSETDSPPPDRKIRLSPGDYRVAGSGDSRSLRPVIKFGAAHKNMKIVYTPIGIIRSPFGEPQGTPIQPAGADGVQGTVELFEKYRAGLKDLAGFSHVILLYHFHRSKGFNLQVVPFMDNRPRGLFATRAPKRPNPIGLSVVRLDRIENGIVHVRNLDILDGTPLLDIKPYVPEFDGVREVRRGWLDKARKTVCRHRADERFR